MQFGFEDSGTTTTDSVVGVSLNLLSSAGTPADYHGPAGSGVFGRGQALNLTSGTAGSGGPLAVTSNNVAINFGSLTNFTITLWIKPTVPIASAYLPRMFCLGNTTTVPGTNAVVLMNNGLPLGGYINTNTVKNSSTFSEPTNQWTFLAMTWDGTNVRFYSGSETNAVSPQGASAAAGGAVNIGASFNLAIGNLFARTRPLVGWIDDVRFYTGVGSSSFLEMVRTDAAGSLVFNWRGGNGTWDINNSGNLVWQNLVGFAYYQDGYPVVFDNTIGSGGLVTLNTNVSPSSVHVNNPRADYTIAGTGGITGSTGLTKSGAGTLTLATSNTYAGATAIEGGVLDVGTINGSNGVSLPSGGIVFTNNGVLQGKGTFTRNFSGLATAATGQLAGQAGGFAAKGGPLTINFGGALATIMLQSGSYKLGNNFVFGSSSADNVVTVSNPISLGMNGGNRTFTVNAGLGGDSVVFAATINNSGGTLGGITKAGPGLLVLSRSNSYDGGTIVTAGTLRATVPGALGSGDVTVLNQAMLELDAAGAMNSSAKLTLWGISNLLNLNFSGTQVVDQLCIGGITCAAGTWGALGTGAANQSAAFIGNGTLQVVNGGTWVARIPSANEIPEDNQFYARDDSGYGTVYYNGTLGGSPDSVFLRVYSNGMLYTNLSQTLVGGAYRFGARIAPGLITYTVQFGSVTAGATNVLNTVTNLVCGDAYIIQGQSNAESDAPGADANPYPTPWIRTYWSDSGWANAVRYNGSNTVGRIGYWGMDLATNLLLTYQIPICIMNGAVGGSRIDQHQPNPSNHYDTNYTYSIYGNLLNRVAAAKLTHGIRGVLWHQGESDCLTNLSGDWRYKAYQNYFLSLIMAWKQDYPNIQHYYLFQIRPDACHYGETEGSDMLREEQRTLPALFSNMSIMSTLGIPGDRALCHYDPAGYGQLADLTAPLVKRDNYGFVPAQAITAPDVKRAYYTSANENEIVLEFGQDMAWNSQATNNFQLDRVAGQITSGSATGNLVKLELVGRATAQTIDYLVDQSASWDGTSANLLYGANGIAALTFYALPIAPPAVPPVVVGLAPRSGRTNGGTLVTLTGSNFLSGASVQFDGSTMPATVNNPTQMTVTTPAHVPSVVNVTVQNPDRQTATLPNGFTFVSPPPPATVSSAFMSGSNLVVAWVGGTNEGCLLLSATNVALPTAGWSVLATNVVLANGRSTNIIPINPTEPKRFYRLSVPYN